jgi:16S rRNA (cytidine1402-2'-O)-methyltransferase
MGSKEASMTRPDSTEPLAGGALFLVATPIGNLEDLSPRARRVLERADLLLAEDTRHTLQLLRAVGIERGLESLHEHNERERVAPVLARLLAGASVALVSDAGTPLVSDPGALLVAAAAAAGVSVIAVPGPCAAIAALAVSGLPSERFGFEGFAPAKPGARKAWLEQRRDETRTGVYYEAPHRIARTLADMAEVFGAERRGVVARELTKRYETVYRGTLGELAQRAAGDADMQRGELAIVVAGAAPRPAAADEREAERTLRTLLAELPASQAAKLAAQLTGHDRRSLYARAVELAQRG